jgi:TDG/mug DNA glycosylase family protein
VPEAVTAEDDDRLPAWGFGVTNIVPRPSPGIMDLRPEEYRAGARVLLRKIHRYQPPVVALVGVTVWRALLDAVGDRPARNAAIRLGLQRLPPESPLAARVPPGTRFFVLPNPSGRNANYSYAEMLAAFRALKRLMRNPRT